MKGQRLSDDQVKALVEYALTGARPPMKRWLGESQRGYNAADDIAEGIDRGIRKGLGELGLAKKP